MQNTEIDSKIPRIQLLEEHLIDQIKAGEVIESPANMVKELIENSLDAGAKKITLKYHNDPLEFFSISDDGHGIHPEDLDLVFARHATSKIHHYNDIYNLSSFGFRGEALASLGAVAKVQIKSKVSMSPSYSLTHQFGKSESLQVHGDVSNSSGTEIIITQLFASTPARLKFIQNKLNEIQKLRKFIHAYVLAYPEVTWDIHENGDFIRYPSEDFLLREANLLSSKITKKELEYKNCKVKLWVDEHPQKKRNNLNQFIFVNNRLINFPVAHAILIKNLNTSPAYAIFIETTNTNLDINIHPAKTEVKFLDKSSVLSLISTLVKSLAPSSTLQTNSFNPTTSSSPLPFIDHESKLIQEHIFESAIPHFKFLAKNGVITYGLRVDKLLGELLESNKVNVDGIPLLVTKPFQCNFTTKDFKTLSYWENLGLNFKLIDKQTIILEALPFGWINTNYELLLNYLLSNNIQDKIYIDKKHVLDLISKEKINSIIELLGEKTLLDKGVLQQLDFLNLHD